MLDSSTLELGAGSRPTPGCHHHDRWAHSPEIDTAHNLDSLPWPWADESFARIIGLDVFEHLHIDIEWWLAECWRILEPEGTLVLRVSAWDNPVSYRDPTHRRVFHEETFDYFCPPSALWADYGRIYFPDGPWFRTISIGRGNADGRWPEHGDICAVLEKVTRP